MLRLKIVAKCLLVGLLALCLLVILLSVIAMTFGTSPAAYRIHQGAGLLFIVLAGIHLVHRRGKWLKLFTQCRDLLWRNQYPSYCNLDRLLATFESYSFNALCAQLQLSPQQAQEVLRRGRIVLAHPDNSLRENVKSNDEMLFSVITLLLKLKLDPESIERSEK